MIHIVLVEPEIPQNTGNISRTCACTGCVLHLVKPLGFKIDDKKLKRAGLDYWQYLDIRYHESLQDYLDEYPDAVRFLTSTHGQICYSEVSYPDECHILFGKETAGLPHEFILNNYSHTIRIPQLTETRSLNLSNSVAIVVYEALRQNHFPNLNAFGNKPE